MHTPPFDIGALEYKSFIEHGNDAMGDCGSGPVDSEFTNDTICHDRGSICTVGFTERVKCWSTPLLLKRKQQWIFF